ncbi:MAG TPA: hypothetical protein VKJ01_07060 [Candidatus Solibacter sp.]|nr:hypothetical protein [Candidatus Solibacter sp.]
MSAATVTPTPTPTATLSRPVPWYVWCGAAAVTFAMVGTHWDISWHRSIGRDSFWTPAHIAIHLCGVLAGISCGYLILSTTLNRHSPLRQCSVTMWGFRGPLGAFLSAWGGVAMITSAPFDNWWHNAYGLDVKILSPPHMVLAAGILAVHVGALILILGQMNRASGAERSRLHALFLYVGGMILVTLTVVQMEITSRSLMHTAHFYRVVALVAPLILAAVARASSYRWAATSVAGVYWVFVLVIGRILPLFPAVPKLGPVNHMVTQFVPPEFPLLLIVPAFALDLLWQRTSHWGGWRQALVSGTVFLAVFAAVQWPFANFLMSPAARNWFFGAKYFGYYTAPSSIYARYLFFRTEPGTAFWMEAALGLATAILGMRLGLAWGNWMRLIKR